ncbi:MAG: hypothetical protein LBV76_03160 [Deltaproteobacteria bacterium]|jgi:hypothetical protein|nr:hypothetical protein [Deltaproteobacteria bacterium]
MSVSPIIAQVAPMEHVARLVQQEQDAGPAKQATLQASAAEAISKANEQVEKTSGGEAGQKVTRRLDGREKKRQGNTPQNNKNMSNRSEDADVSGDAGDKGDSGESSASPAASPDELFLMNMSAELESEPTTDVWTGNIVNVKV